MKVYFVRHGETEDNFDNVHQTADSKLSEHGIQQATLVAKRFQKIPIDVIISSDQHRAFTTASIINSVLQKPLVPNPLLREIKRPTEIEGKKRKDPEVMKIKKEIRENWHKADWHYSDEENYPELVGRFQQFINSLTTRKDENILVVTHGVTIKMIFLLTLLKEVMSPQLFHIFEHDLYLNNTGITLFEIEDNTWRLITWNDHAHLG